MSHLILDIISFSYQKDLILLIKISQVSKFYNNLFKNTILYHDMYIKYRLKNLPIIQPIFSIYGEYSKLQQTDYYNNDVLIKYLGRINLNIDEIASFNIYLIKKCLQYSKTIRNPDVSIFECDINGRIIQLPNNSGYIKMDNNYKGYTIKTYRRMLGKYFDIRFDINQFQTNYLKNLSEIMLTRLKNLPM